MWALLTVPIKYACNVRNIYKAKNLTVRGLCFQQGEYGKIGCMCQSNEKFTEGKLLLK